MRLIDADVLTEFVKARMALWSKVDEVLDGISDAPEILKEQDAVEPICISKSELIHVYKCGNCGMPLVGKVRYCYECGRKVKWDALD